MACPPPGDALEDAFFDALEGAGSWAIEDDELVLMDADGDELLRFEPAPQSWSRSVVRGRAAQPLGLTATFLPGQTSLA